MSRPPGRSLRLQSSGCKRYIPVGLRAGRPESTHLTRKFGRDELKPKHTVRQAGDEGSPAAKGAEWRFLVKRGRTRPRDDSKVTAPSPTDQRAAA